MIIKDRTIPNFHVDYFKSMDEDILIEKARFYPDQFRRMCMLISLDIQLEKERYEKSSSYRRTMHR